MAVVFEKPKSGEKLYFKTFFVAIKMRLFSRSFVVEKMKKVIYDYDDYIKICYNIFTNKNKVVRICQ